MSPGDLNGRIGMNLEYGLVLTDVEYSDQGFYSCKGTNALGEAFNSTQVKIMGIYIFIFHPLSIVVHYI